jgi:anti-sigma regulatory factor (Ser/Thr protein kinase)/serine/threonine protein phosphatase PrpC
MAEAIGFSEVGREEIALVVSELGSNLVEHAGGGTLMLRPIGDEERDGLEIESVDNGPGIRDVERAITDGYTTGDSLGYGLGTVNRLTDEFEIDSRGEAGGGTHIVCQRWLRRRPIQASQLCPLDFGAATRAHPGLRVNGDAFVIRRWDETALVAVIDGLGHGQYAHRASSKARDYVERHADQELTRMFRGVGRACRATRGVVMAVARFNWGGETLTFGTVGDVAARVFGSREPIHFRIRRGILGGQAPNPVVTHHPWDPANILVLHSDGLTSRWRWTDFPSLSGESATVGARKLLHTLAKDNDDATVVVVKGAEGRRSRGGKWLVRRPATTTEGAAATTRGDRPQQPGGTGHNNRGATTTGRG